MTFNVLVKTGFKNLDPKVPIVINDNRGILFYDSRVLPNPVKTFNLPKGQYFKMSGNFKPLPKPVNFKIYDLPPKQRHNDDARKFDILYGVNPSKCTIDWVDKTILFDNQFKNSPRPIKDWILFHEYGHRYYGTEVLADLFSRNLMIIKGYNPSQIGLAPILTLGNGRPENEEMGEDELLRKSAVIKSLT